MSLGLIVHFFKTKQKTTFLFIVKFIYLFLAALGLTDAYGFFPSCSKWELLSSGSMGASLQWFL